MTKERELLRRALSDLEWSADFCGNKSLLEEIRAYLNQSEIPTGCTLSDDAEEPVAWMFQHEDTGLIDYVDTQQVEWGFEKNNPRWQKIGPVYLHQPRPEPARKPMTEEEISKAYQIHFGEKNHVADFWDGVRFAEKHHGIGKDDEE